MSAPSQRALALERANEVRRKRTALKHDLKHGRVALTDVLTNIPSWLEGARVYAFILAVPHVGEQSADAILFRAGVPFPWRFRQLTDRQREALIERLNGENGSKCDQCGGPASDGCLRGVCRACITANSAEWRSKAAVLLRAGVPTRTVGERVGRACKTIERFAREMRGAER